MTRPNIPPDQFAKWLRELPPEVRVAVNREEIDAAKREYEEFRNALQCGQCYLCSGPLTSFSVEAPCLHWLLNPQGFEKKHLPLITLEFTLYQVMSYVRWLASVEGFGKNINDLVEEHHGAKLVDFTAKYKDISWSFSCGESDFRGHEGSKSGNLPHYHFQMMLAGKPFIRYSDFHIPLTPDDRYDLVLFLRHKDIARHTFGPGTGMQSLLDGEEAGQRVVETATIPVDPNEAAFQIHTMVLAQNGKTLSGDVVADLIQGAKQRGCTAASIVSEYFPDARIIQVVGPGDGVIDPKPRSRRRQKKRSSWGT